MKLSEIFLRAAKHPLTNVRDCSISIIYASDGWNKSLEGINFFNKVMGSDYDNYNNSLERSLALLFASEIAKSEGL